MSKTRFIIALLANEPGYFIQYAQQFADKAAGYLLGKDVHPHVTIVQFMGEQADFDAIVNFLQDLRLDFQPRFLGLHFNFNIGIANQLWTALTVARDPKLIALQGMVIDFLEKRDGVKILTYQKDLYDPHLTLALINGDVPACQRPCIPEGSFSLSAGIADGNGQFIDVKKVFTKQREKCRL